MKNLLRKLSGIVQMYIELVVSWKLYKALQGCERLKRYPDGAAKIAFDELIAIGQRALPMLEKWNKKFMDEYIRQVKICRKNRSKRSFIAICWKCSKRELWILSKP